MKKRKTKAPANKRVASTVQLLIALRDAAFTFDPVKHLAQELHNKSQQGSSLARQASAVLSAEEAREPEELGEGGKEENH